MKNGLTTYCASAIATITRGLASFLPKNERSVRPKACLVIRIPQAHWLDLVGMVKDEHGPVPSVDLHETANDVIVVGVLTWMSKQRSDFLAEFCRSRNVQLVKVGDVSGAK
ncbi:hypothetical protein ID866_7950 [Astraeus odoratus]|nr:hypothetical protein ID866_7950 [Astraeus odoratus]